MRRLLNRLVTVQEDERRRVARDLHDHLGQQMSALRFKLSSLPESGDETYRATRDEAQRLLDRLDRDLDFLTWQLRPALLDDLGLKPALARFVEEWSTSGGVQVELEASRLPDQRYDPQVETHLYRIVQEALNNVLKHARASHVGIVLERREGQLTALIEDDGQGFDLAGVDASPEQRGLGLVGMRERAALVGGVVEVETAPGKGTTVFVRMPVA